MSELITEPKLELMLGNEAIARGAWEAGVKLAVAYPGTPSTEIIESLREYDEVNVEWATNEKVALEVALGASIAGIRTIYASKHVGLNVAADPLFSSAITGVRAGLLIVTADDPGMHSSQNEQDNRLYGLSAKLPVLCPSDSQEAKDLTILGFELSEKYDIPVILRSTTRLSHTRTPVKLGERREVEHKGYERNPSKYMVLPMYARKRRVDLDKRIELLKEYSNRSGINEVIEGKGDVGIVGDGVAFLYGRELFPDAWALKLRMSFPFPHELAYELAKHVKVIYVFEENDPFIELHLRALNLGVEIRGKGYPIGKEYIPRAGELSVDRIKVAIDLAEGRRSETQSLSVKSGDLPSRPPTLCPGCTHRPVFWALARFKNLIITGDIGCYTLGALPPLNAMETCVDMGASITMAHGIAKALENTDDKRKVVAVIGDSTFFHSGITGLIHAVYNQSDITVIILDNDITAMTGHQEHPGTGRTAKGQPAPRIDIVKLVEAIGVKKVLVVDPYDPKETLGALREAINFKGVSVVVARRPCPLYIRYNEGAYKVVQEACAKCNVCVGLGCPAINVASDGTISINSLLCIGCGVCAKLCPHNAIVKLEDREN